MQTLNDLGNWLKNYFPRLINGRIPVDIGSSSVGGNSFDGQLTQGGSGVSTGNPLPVQTVGTIPTKTSITTATSGTVVSVQTAAIGTNYTPFGNVACNALDLINESGVDVQYLRNGAGTPFVLKDGRARLIIGITNANQISVRRVDSSNTQITLQGEAFVV